MVPNAFQTLCYDPSFVQLRTKSGIGASSASHCHRLYVCSFLQLQDQCHVIAINFPPSTHPCRPVSAAKHPAHLSCLFAGHTASRPACLSAPVTLPAPCFSSIAAPSPHVRQLNIMRSSAERKSAFLFK